LEKEKKVVWQYTRWQTNQADDTTVYLASFPLDNLIETRAEEGKVCSDLAVCSSKGKTLAFERSLLLLMHQSS